MVSITKGVTCILNVVMIVLLLIYLFSDGYYNVITSLTAAFACHYYCEACNTPYDHKLDHRCSSIFPVCSTVSPPCKIEHSGINCPQCSRHFKNNVCFTAQRGNDRMKNVYIVKRLWGQRAVQVNTSVVRCILKSFLTLKSRIISIIRKRTLKNKTKTVLFIFFASETRQDQCLESESGVKVHKVNLCVSQQYYSKCR